MKAKPNSRGWIESSFSVLWDLIPFKYHKAHIKIFLEPLNPAQTVDTYTICQVLQCFEALSRYMRQVPDAKHGSRERLFGMLAQGPILHSLLEGDQVKVCNIKLQVGRGAEKPSYETPE